MKTTIACPEPDCQKLGREHQMFWVVHKGGKRELVYRCDRIPSVSGDEADKEMRYKNSIRPVLHPEKIPADVLAVLPVKWTRGHAAHMAGKNQFQLLLMHKKQ